MSTNARACYSLPGGVCDYSYAHLDHDLHLAMTIIPHEDVISSTRGQHCPMTWADPDLLR